MSDYQTWTRRDVLHVDGWGWRVELSEFGPDGARALAAAIVAAVGDWERMEVER